MDVSFGRFTTRLFVYRSDICLYRCRFFFAFFCIVSSSRSYRLFFSRWLDRSHFSFQPCLTCPQLPSVVVFAFVAPTKLRARAPPRGVRPLHIRRLMLNYLPLLVLVVSCAALVAGLPGAMMVGRWARWVYYAAHLFWLFLVVMLWTYFVATFIS